MWGCLLLIGICATEVYGCRQLGFEALLCRRREPHVTELDDVKMAHTERA